ncbi:TIGR01621 family pseudouridine synthase [Vibrio sp. SM6]|uniref:TIGR01621 family pseudouridine synthase n=1 Tax=Vibrio agarilyticus TaxID=2726741 RepID=A0A7X8TMQ1_9VIBR|nr:TIGR01621 family pseudouridine synthase [Vibrio agarilyticus]NLS11404.1 TIGR01621 family pseudouridine synthase [Vibrio agarilyticus]
MFDILYTHPDFIIINKHPNVSVHKDDGDTMLVAEVAKQSGDAALYLVHRLDKMTSGLLILARSSSAAAALSSLFAQKTIAKFYLAIGSKKPKKKQGWVIGDMERSRRAAWKLIATKANPAVTQFFSLPGESGQRLFLCKPHTGKTHQIRVALKSVGSPILGDPIYNANNSADRGYLHAYALVFDYQGAHYSFICDPRQSQIMGALWHTAAACAAIDQWQQPWGLTWPTLSSRLD